MTAFRTSARFGLLGVFVVAALVLVIALAMGQGQAKPKDAFALIFGILAVFLVLLDLWLAERLSQAAEPGRLSA